MNIKLQIKHAWKTLTLPRQSHYAQIMRFFERNSRLEEIRNRKKIYDISDMD
jgi:hypothetical protein